MSIIYLRLDYSFNYTSYEISHNKQRGFRGYDDNLLDNLPSLNGNN